MKNIAYYPANPKRRNRAAVQARQAAVEAVAPKVVESYVEIEDGKKEGWPKLKDSIAHVQKVKGRLVIAELGRFVNNPAFAGALRDSGIEFYCCDMPHVNSSNIGTFAATAETLSLQISRKVRDTLAQAKKSGTKLGSARKDHWKGREHLRGWAEGAKSSAKKRSERAEAAYAPLLPKITAWREEGKTMLEVATLLNQAGHTTTEGMPFTEVAISRIIKRYLTKAA
jgi:DNA invertase Pin-like site-specific DNA recombinase